MNHQAKRPVTSLAGPYGHPFHPALVAFPIGAWLASFIFDLAAQVVDRPDIFAQGSRWLILLGVLGALVAAMFGFLDLLAIPTGTRVHRIALLHAGLNLAVVSAFVVNFLLRGADDAGVGVGLIVLSAVTLAVLTAAAFFGGELAYRYGVRVADESTQAGGYDRPAHKDDEDEEEVRTS